MVLLLTSLLIWASLSIDGASGYSNIDRAKCKGPTSGGSIGGWNGIGQGFLNMFTPNKLTDQHWQIIGKMKKNFEGSLIKEFAFSMGGVVFLVVVSIILILLFCAAPISYCVYSCTCKKKCKPKSNAIVAYTGLGCTSVAILTISLSILFCYLSISSIKISEVGLAVKQLPDVAVCIVKNLKEEVSTEARKLTGTLTASVDKIPTQLADKIWEIPTLQAVLKIDIAGKVKQIDGFATETDLLSGNLAKMITDMRQAQSTNPTYRTALDTPIQNMEDAQREFGKITTELKSGTIKQKLQAVSDERDKTTKSTIETKIKEKTGESTNKISKVAEDVDKKINGGFNTEGLKKEISKITEKIESNVDKAKDYTGYLNAVMLVLFPCGLALASAIWSCCQATKFVQKKKAKPKEKGGLLIPLAIGLALAFLPLLTSTAFMSLSAVSNVVCSTVFKDESFGFLPNALHAFDVNSTLSIKGINLEISSVLQKCKNGESMIAAINGESLLDENMVTKQFDINAKKTELDTAITNIDFALPSTTSWDEIKTKLDMLKTNRISAKTQIDALLNFKIGALTLEYFLPTITKDLNALDEFLKKVEKFEEQCGDDITVTTALNKDDLKKEMKKILLGEGTTAGQLQKMLDTINAEYKKFRTDLLTQSTNCGYLFDIFKTIGETVCVQGLGGFNGIYAAIGLAVFSYFSAACGTVMIWHSLRAGKEKKEEKSSDDSKKNKKKKKKGEGEEGEGGEGEEDPLNMAGKIGEQGEPMKKPISSEPTPPAGQPPLVQAVPTDPAAPGEKTNPSLLPNDAPLAAGPGDPAVAAGLQPESGGPTAGTPLSPNPIQMVNMEANNNNPASQKSDVQQKSDKQNSITGAGGGETAGGAGATNPQ